LGRPKHIVQGISTATDSVYHASEESGLARFDPRPPATTSPVSQGCPVVWAIGERLLHNYLLPRACPRFTFYAGPDTSAADNLRYLGDTDARHVVAVESGWLDTIRHATIYLYEFPGAEFELADPVADYFVSYGPVFPRAERRIDDLLAELLRRDVELRVTPTLWPLRDAVLASSLSFSFIRMRNARPRELPAQ
jgi:hypothetical protein